MRSPAIYRNKRGRESYSSSGSSKSSKNSALTLLQAVFIFFGGLVMGLILSMIPWKKRLRKEKSKQTISAKKSKEVLQLLMGNMQGDSEIEGLVQKLSENLYEGKSHEINKKRLKEIVKKLQVKT